MSRIPGAGPGIVASLTIGVLVGCLGEGREVGSGGAALVDCATASCDGPTELVVPADADHVWTGLSTPESSAAPAAIAEAYLDGMGLGPARLVRVAPAGAGILVRFQQTHQGLDVVGGELALRLDVRGRVRWVSPRVTRVPPDLSTTPSATPDRALAQAMGLPQGAEAPLDPADHTRLVVYSGPGVRRARLAWVVVYADELARQTYRVYVDARDGSVLSREGLVRRAPGHRARVYDVSPADSELEEVVFDALPEGATTLADADVEVRNCIDERQCHAVLTTSGVRNVHYCEMRSTAFTDAEGTFLGHRRPRSDRDPEDTFAEVQGYHHIRSGLAAFRDWSGDPGFVLGQRLTLVVNMRVPDLSSDVSLCDAAGAAAPAGSQLQIEENAYFWPAGQIGPVELGDRVVMHQAERTDWAYDGEIVYHELTHAVMHTTTPLAWRTPDGLGVNTAGGGLHEGFSDYFAAVLTNRAQLSWYGGTTASGPEAMTDLEKPADCRTILSGEEHDESAAWAGALWAIHRSLRSAEKREMFDGVAFTVISSLGEHDGFARAAELLLAELDVASEELIDRAGFDASEADYLRSQVAAAPQKLIERGLPDCNGRVLTMRPGDTKEYLQLMGPPSFGLARFAGEAMPAPMQIRVVLESAAPALRVHIAESAENDNTLKGPGVPSLPELSLILKRADDPIRWAWDLPRGDHDGDDVVPVPLADDSSATVILEGPFPAGAYHLQFANSGADWNLYGIIVQAADASGEFDDLPADRWGADPAAGVSTPPSCTVSPLPTPGASWVMMIAAGILAFRRRARS